MSASTSTHTHTFIYEHVSELCRGAESSSWKHGVEVELGRTDQGVGTQDESDAGREVELPVESHVLDRALYDSRCIVH